MTTVQRHSTIHERLPSRTHKFPPPPASSSAGLKATLHWRSNTKAQVQPRNVFSNGLGRAAVVF